MGGRALSPVVAEGPTYLDGLLGAIGFGLGLLPGAPGAEAFASASAFFSELPTAEPRLIPAEVVRRERLAARSSAEPVAWLIRFLLATYTLQSCWAGCGTGMDVRRHYRAADWTPTDDVIDRLRPLGACSDLRSSSSSSRWPRSRPLSAQRRP